MAPSLSTHPDSVCRPSLLPFQSSPRLHGSFTWALMPAPSVGRRRKGILTAKATPRPRSSPSQDSPMAGQWGGGLRVILSHVPCGLLGVTLSRCLTVQCSRLVALPRLSQPHWWAIYIQVKALCSYQRLLDLTFAYQLRPLGGASRMEPCDIFGPQTRKTIKQMLTWMVLEIRWFQIILETYLHFKKIWCLSVIQT